MRAVRDQGKKEAIVLCILLAITHKLSRSEKHGIRVSGGEKDAERGQDAHRVAEQCLEP